MKPEFDPLSLISPIKKLIKRNTKKTGGSEFAPAQAKTVEISIGNLLGPNTIFLVPNPPEKKSELLKFLVLKISQNFPHVPLERAFQAVMEREKMTSTFMDTGIAIPHARLPDLSGNPAALAILPGGFTEQKLHIKKETKEDPGGAETPSVQPPTHFIFLFLSPENQLIEHLQILSRVSWIFQKPDLREKLLKVQNPAEALRIIQEAERDTPHA